jgi:hypothetical protein
VHSLRNTSDVQLSAFGVPPAGYMSSTSMLAYFFMRSMREQGAWIWLPIVAGTAIHLPFNLAEILHHAVNFAVLPDDRRLAVLIPRLQNEKCDHPIPAYDEKGVFTAEAWNVLG